MEGLRGKNVLVTGGSSGIGQSIAVRFGQEGANVGINISSVHQEIPKPRFVGYSVSKGGMQNLTLYPDFRTAWSSE